MTTLTPVPPVGRLPPPQAEPRTVYRVLVAEDDPELRRLVAAALRKDGLEVIEVEDGNELHLEMLFDGVGVGRLPDLVVTDIRMPGRNGLDVVAAVRRRGWTTPVVFITAFGDDATHQRARSLGQCTVVDKPFELDDLRLVVRGALAG